MKENNINEANDSLFEKAEDEVLGDINNKKDEELDKDNEKKIIEKYELKLKESSERLIRLQADFENFKKRVAKEREEVYLYSLEGIMTQLLSVADNFDRALDSFKVGKLDKEYIEGIKMVYDNFLEILYKNGLTEIEAIDCIFDPNYHHAVMQEEGEEDDNTVKEVFQKGYMLNSKVIRPCMVKVAIKK